MHGPEWTPARYAQLDFWLADESFVRSCKDVPARTDIYFPSDHYIVEAVFAVKLSASNTHKQERVSKFRQPTNAEWHAYNQKLTELIQAEPTQEWKDIPKAIAQAAACSLTKLSHRQQRGYISRNTWDLIEKRQAAHEQGRNVEVIELNRNISVNAKKDKRSHVLDSLKEMPAQKEKWQGVRGLKSGFKPRFTQLKDIRGNFVPPKKRAECFAEYLEQKHWTSHSFSEVESFDDILSDRALFSVDEFTAIGYDDALKNAKSNKQPGPDGLAMELFKWMNHTNRANILKHINKWWITAKAPPEIFLARVVCIFKKGNTDDAANYRPISLLNSVYKLYMSMIRNRMQQVLEGSLCSTQYGFRPGRSTAHAIYLTRRMQDIAEQQGSNLVITMLDWEKAFDKIVHDRLAIAMDRLGVHPHYINTIMNGYEQAMFYVEDEYGTQDVKKQHSGIRQGCPLSPYLFVFVMSVIDSDVGNKLTTRTTNSRHDGIGFDRVYFTDDTLLITTNTRAANNVPHHVERISEQYGLQLNRDKCCYVAMNGDNTSKFRDGTRLKRVTEATYLGHQITHNMNVKHEINCRMQQTLITWYKLEPFWKAAACSAKWKLEV